MRVRDDLWFHAADDFTAHIFRREVAAALEGDWPERARALRSCGEAGAALSCSCCGVNQVVPFRCGARSCPSCARIASAAAVDKLMARLTWALEVKRIRELWEGPGWPAPKVLQMLTLTQQTPFAYGDGRRFHFPALRKAIRRARDGWSASWRMMPWGQRIKDRSPSGQLGTRLRRDIAWAMGVEVAPGGMVHVHAAVLGERVREEDVRKPWEQSIGRRGFVRVSPVKEDAGTLRKAFAETLKYVSKGEKGPRRYDRAAVMELAFRGTRRVEMGGAFRTRGELLGPRDIMYQGANPCPCGTGSPLDWVGVIAPPLVAANGGYGIATTHEVQARLRAMEILRAHHETQNRETA